MESNNKQLGRDVKIDASSSVNNAIIGDGVKIAKFCSVYGREGNLLEIGAHSYVGMFSILNGYARKLTIGCHVSIAQNVNIMTDSGPNASVFMQQFYPVVNGDVTIEDHAWIGAGVIIMPNVRIGRCSIVAANSFVNTDIEAYSLYGGNPARLIKKLDDISDYESKKV